MTSLFFSIDLHDTDGNNRYKPPEDDHKIYFTGSCKTKSSVLLQFVEFVCLCGCLFVSGMGVR